MAPAVVQRTPSGHHVRRVSRSLSSTFASLRNRAADASEPSLVSAFALVIAKGSHLSARAASAVSDTFTSSPEARAATGPISLSKRQDQILAIPTTYKGLNAGPAPGAVVGIILGSVAGFILCLYILLYAFHFHLGRSTIVEEEVITTTRRRSQSRRSSHHTVMSERPAPSARRETIIIEETRRQSAPPPDLDEVIVEEHEDDIVEVIEDPSSVSSRTPPPAKPSRRESRRSGYRTVDPAEFGGGRDRYKGVGRR